MIKTDLEFCIKNLIGLMAHAGRMAHARRMAHADRAFWTHKPTPALHFLQNASPPWSATTLPKFCSWDVELRRVVGLTNSWLNDHEVLHNLLGVM